MPVPTGALPAGRNGNRLPQPALLVGLAVLEALGVAAILRYLHHPLVLLLTLHILMLTATVALIAWTNHQRGDVTLLVLGLLGGAIVGPVGFLGAATLWRVSAGHNQPSPLVEDWYTRITNSTSVSPEERLCEDVEVGRTLDAAAPPPLSFPGTMAHGALAEQQAILGQIARQFHPAYLATLKIALASPEPVVRVQAAAVAAHVNPKVRRLLRQRFEEASRAPLDPMEALSLLDDIAALLGSGLLEEAERQAAQALVRRLGDVVVNALSEGPLCFESIEDRARAAILVRRLEALLIERRCFAELRVQRTAARLTVRFPRARLKRFAVVRTPLREATP
ncbi:MAG: hypothetical protein R3D44_13890 [Hyphomicrobiaceae bacterium]